RFWKGDIVQVNAAAGKTIPAWKPTGSGKKWGSLKSSPVPTITWRKLNGNLPSRARLRKSRAWLEVLNTQSSDTGTYECRVENTRGGNVVRGFLQVYARPYWTQTINDTRLDSGQELRWVVSGSWEARPSYRWLKDGKPLTSSRVTVKNTLFTITRVNQSDSGMYQCIEQRNQYGAVFASAEATVTASAPSFDMYPVAKETLVCVGRDLCLECRPRSSPKASISWSKGERPLVGARVNISQEGTLRISNITHSDSGTYTCRAENIFGASSSSGIVYVKEATEVHLVPSKLDVTAGESALLTCRVTHDPTLQVHVLWSFDGRDLDFQREGGHFESVRAQSPSADLMIRNIQLVHTGRYSCRAWTAVDASSGTAELLVRGPPGSPGVVIVEEIFSTTATLSWSPGRDNHSPVTQYNIQARNPFSLGWQAVTTVPDPITGDLESAVAVQLNPWMDYEFRVVATNSIGTGDPSLPSRLVRTQEAIPSVSPANVSGGGGKRNELVIAWEPVSEEFHHGKGFGYLVAFRPNGTRAWRETMVAVTDMCRYVYRDESLQPLTPFEVKVGVYNNKGDGPFSPVAVVYSAEGEPQTVPSNITVSSLSASEILVSWRSMSDGSPQLQGYQVSVWKKLEQELSKWTVSTSGNDSSAMVSGLQGNTAYLVSVRAYNSAGFGPSSVPRMVTTKKSPPSQAPLNILWHQDDSAVSLGWEPVRNKDDESEVMGYKVLYRQEGNSLSEVIETREPSAIIPLQQEGVYIIEVRAFSEGGDATVSSQIRVPKSSGRRSTAPGLGPFLGVPAPLGLGPFPGVPAPWGHGPFPWCPCTVGPLPFPLVSLHRGATALSLVSLHHGAMALPPGVPAP
ncbi:LOW QUALITY PROTEIN: contactin-5-like, partial [Heterodontus francisci]|uniref:LOW QUALITY PROTEIN: contactin-5-like n=1 Tax=Heterodontus francisci TaxID=7792 RepID=UPI00355B2505